MTNTPDTPDQVDALDAILEDRFMKPKADLKGKLSALLVEVRIQGELYGRLHHTIEDFQAGRISAAVYSELHEQITEELEKQREVQT